jgi:uncharacterized protein (DUF3084 family)
MVSNLLSIVLATVGWNIVWLLIEMTVPVEPRTVPVTNPEFQPDSDPEPEMKSERIEMMRKPPGATLATPPKDEDTENSNPCSAETKITEDRVQKIETDHLFYQEQIDGFKKKFQNLSSTIEGFEEMDQENRLLKEKVSTWVTTESELRRENSYLKAEIKTKDQEIEKKDQEIEKKDQEIKTKDQEIKTKDQEKEKKDQEIEKKDQEIKGKDQQIKRNDQQIKIKDQKLDLMSVELEMMAAEVDSIQTTLTKKFFTKLDYFDEYVNPRILQLETEKLLLESTLNNLRKSSSRNRSRIEELEAENTQLRESCEAAQNQIAKLSEALTALQEPEPSTEHASSSGLTNNEQTVNKKGNRIAKWLEKHGFLKRRKVKEKKKAKE